MSRNRLYAAGLLVVALALTLALPVAPDAEAGPGPIVPIFEEYVVAIATVGDDTYIATSDLLATMEQVYGSATLDTFANAINNAPVANPATEFVMHGCEAAGGAVQLLSNKGYDTSAVQSSSFPGVSDDTVYTD